MTQYALRAWNMYIRKMDGKMTDNRASAILFRSIADATQYVSQWRITTTVEGGHHKKIEVVEVETKEVISKVKRVVSLV
jgi:hypothetical protein